MSVPCKQCHDTAHPSGWTASDGFGSDSCRLRWHEARVVALEAALRTLIIDFRNLSPETSWKDEAIEAAREVLG